MSGQSLCNIVVASLHSYIILCKVSVASLHSYIILLLHCTRILICKASTTSKLLLHCTSFCIILIFEMHMALSKYVFSVNKVQTCVFCTNFCNNKKKTISSCFLSWFISGSACVNILGLFEGQWVRLNWSLKKILENLKSLEIFRTVLLEG